MGRCGSKHEKKPKNEITASAWPREWMCGFSASAAMSRNLHTPPSLTFACRGPSGVPKKQRNRVAVMDAHASPPSRCR